MTLDGVLVGVMAVLIGVVSGVGIAEYYRFRIEDVKTRLGEVMVQQQTRIDALAAVHRGPQRPRRKRRGHRVGCMKTSNDYSPAVAVWPSGKTQPCNVKRALVLTPDAATARLREAGTVVVYVRTSEDAAAVLAGVGCGETQ